MCLKSAETECNNFAFILRAHEPVFYLYTAHSSDSASAQKGGIKFRGKKVFRSTSQSG
jgi:hypothetical protein